MSAPLIALPAILANAEGSGSADPVWTGMNTFEDYAVKERWDVVDAYRGEDPEYDEKLGMYVPRLARTALLVCTSIGNGGAEKREEPASVAPGLVVRALGAVLRHERVERIRIMEQRYVESGGKRRFGGEYGKEGPLDKMTEAAGYKRWQVEGPYDLTDKLQSSDKVKERLADELLGAAEDNATFYDSVTPVLAETVTAQTGFEREQFERALNKL